MGKRATYSPYKEKTVMLQKYSEKATLQKKGIKMTKHVAVGTHAYRRMKNDLTKGRGVSESIKTKNEAKQNKRDTR